MLENSWSNKLSQEPKFSTIVNVPKPAIIYQTQANQLMVHSQGDSPLPIRKDVLSLGSLRSGEILLLTRYQLICFDLLNNNEVFSLEFENAQTLYVEEQLIFVVCGCDLFCYNLQGEEQYVNHCSALIEALTTVEIKGSREVLLGLADLNLLRYRGVNISLDYGKIVGAPVSMCWLDSGVLLGTQEGTVAFYEGKKSRWRAKSSHPVVKVLAHRTESEYLAIVGRRDGLVELKDWKNKGETISKVKLHEELVGIHIHDFRQEDNEQLICVLKSGNVKGLNIYEEPKKNDKKMIADEVKLEQQSYELLQAQKLALEFEVTQLREKIAEAATQQQSLEDDSILQKDFNYQTFLHHEPQGLALSITCFNGYISGLAFEEQILPVSYDRATQIKYVFKAQNMVFGQINCNALVHSNYTSKIYESRQFKITLPKFWKYDLRGEGREKPAGSIKFKMVERTARYIKWISQCFFMKWTEEDRNKLENQTTLRLKFYNAYDQVDLEFHFFTKEARVQILCDELKTLGEVFQDLVEYVGAKELNSELTFPKEKEKLKETLAVIEKLSQAKVNISSEMAEAIDNIKFLLVKGESARCVASMKDLRRTFSDIMGFNRNLLIEIEKKNHNTKQLSESLKTLGQLINQTANVRYGKAKEQMVAACREAIKKKEFPRILTIMQRGVTLT